MSKGQFTAVPPGATPVTTEPRKRDNRKIDGLPRIQVVEAVQNAAANIVKTRNTKLTEDEIAQLLILLAEGATNERINKVFKKRFKRDISSATITRYREQHRSDIVARAQELDKLAIDTGLAKRSMRLRRLQLLAEAIEERLFSEDGSLAVGDNSKLLSEYRGVMALIGAEAGDLVPSGAGDALFVGMNDEDLKAMLAGKLGAHKDLAVILAERAGVRPTIEGDEKSAGGDFQSGHDSPGDGGGGAETPGESPEVV